jgi:hypothetical protein
MLMHSQKQEVIDLNGSHSQKQPRMHNPWPYPQKIYYQQSEEPSPAWKTLIAKCNTKDEFGRQVRQAYVESEAESETVQIMLPAQRRAAGGNTPQSCNRDTEIAQNSTTE